MAVLDLQTMTQPSTPANRAPARSGASKGCNVTSSLSLLLCVI